MSSFNADILSYIFAIIVFGGSALGFYGCFRLPEALRNYSELKERREREMLKEAVEETLSEGGESDESPQLSQVRP